MSVFIRGGTVVNADRAFRADVLCDGGKIVAVGPASGVIVPAGARRVALAGKTVIPGLVNAHGHVGNTVGMEQGKYSAENVAKDLKTYAAYGVTTVYSLGDDQAAGFAARDSQRSRSLDRARLFVAGPVLNPKSPADAVTLVDEDAAMKVDIVKIRVDDNLGATRCSTPAPTSSPTASVTSRSMTRSSRC